MGGPQNRSGWWGEGGNFCTCREWNNHPGTCSLQPSQHPDCGILDHFNDCANLNWVENFFSFICYGGNSVQLDLVIPRLKGKAIPLQAWPGPRGSRRHRLPESVHNRHMKIARLQPYVPAAFTPTEDSWYSVLLEAELTPGP